MASAPLFSFRPAGIRACSASGRNGGSGPNKAATWWSPIFGWAPEAAEDWIGGAADAGAAAPPPPARTASGRKFAALTEEKARQLRMKTLETYTFHDPMYHSAIASRLASDFKNRSE